MSEDKHLAAWPFPIQSVDDSLFTRVRKIVCEQSYLSESAVSLDSTFETLKLDSLDQVELIMGLEEEFKIEIQDEIADKWKSVKDCIEYLKNLKKEQT